MYCQTISRSRGPVSRRVHRCAPCCRLRMEPVRFTRPHTNPGDTSSLSADRNSTRASSANWQPCMFSNAGFCCAKKENCLALFDVDDDKLLKNKVCSISSNVQSFATRRPKQVGKIICIRWPSLKPVSVQQLKINGLTR